ncbi:MAG TPA: dienelactone hydrolase family protein [Candidatus Paceibacterota bacterium]
MKNILIISVILIVVLAGFYFFGYKTETKDSNNADMLSGNGSLRIKSEEINYFKNINGFLARPESDGPYPGIVMIHEWWGLNENIKDMAQELAKEGYAVLAVDLFGKVATTSDEARTQVSSLNQDLALSNLRAATAYLRNEGVEKIASLGWCFGGGQSLQLSLSGEELSATVIYYGQLTSDEKQLSMIHWPVLGIFGEEDQSIKVETVNDFENTLNGLGKTNDIYIYPAVGHAFANPSGTNYAPEETKDAWAKTLTFLAANLK